MNRPDTMTHEQAIELLPWLVNDSLPADERQSLLEHSRDCIICRRDIAELEALQSDLAAADSDEPVPAPDMRRINRRIDDYESGRDRVADRLRALGQWLGRPLHALVAVQSLFIAALLALHFAPQDPAQPVYTTLTSGTSLPAGNYLRVVVSTRLADDDWQSLLREFGLTAVEGPSAQGVATLAFDRALSRDARDGILAELAAHPGLRFVQPLTVTSP